MSNGTHRSHAALQKTVAVSRSEKLSCLHGINRFLRTVYADHQCFSIGRIQSLDGSERHRIIRRKDAVKLRMRLKQVLGDLQRHSTLKIRRLRGEQLYAGKL